MTRVATSANESVPVHVARHGTAAHVEKLVRKFHWTQRRDAAKLAQAQHEQRSVAYFFDVEGEFILNARLPPEIGAVVRGESMDFSQVIEAMQFLEQKAAAPGSSRAWDAAPAFATAAS